MAGLGVLPVVSVLSGGIAALLVLVSGVRQALIISIAAAGLLAIMTLLTQGNPLFVAGSKLIIWLIVIAVASVIKKTGSLKFALQILVLLAMVAAGTWVMAIPDPAAFWGEDLMAANAVLFGEFGEAQLELVREMAVYMPAVIACSVLLTVLAGLMLGRWCQSSLQKPGAFAVEARLLGLGRVVAIVGLLIFVVAAVTGHALFVNLALVLGFGFVIHALSVVHALVAMMSLPAGFLVAIYATLVFLAALVGPIMASLGFMDVWMDFRARAASRRNK